MTVYLVLAGAAAFAAVPWVVVLRSLYGDEGTLDEWRRTGRRP